ncbi:RIP metalloprotease RseP [Alphaproteobacteria bacterium]|nr:RIP metalloprotease RseP [Alphaproteobacteria bacterium]
MFFLESLSSIISWVAPFLVVLTVLVFIHELGHYLVARYNGVKIEVFSIGFGPEIFGWTDSKETRWKFSLIPLGGYVRMFGDANEASAPNFDQLNKLSEQDKNQTLEGKTVWQRMAVSVAGPLANILLTFALLSIFFFSVGKPSDAPVIGIIKAESVAEKAGLESGDRILRMNDFSPNSFKDIQTYINARPDEGMTIQIERQGKMAMYSIVPGVFEISSSKSVGVIGVGPSVVKKSLFEAPVEALRSVGTMSFDLLRMLGSVVSSGKDASRLGSVLSIAKMSKDSFQGGIFPLLFFMAILSLNLGVINLLPIPMLDGGHLLFYIIEAIKGSPVAEKAQEISYRIGFGILIFVMLFTLWNDFSRFKIVEYFLKLFREIFF